MKADAVGRVDRYTHLRVTDPQPGDHFTEMCGSVALIEARDGDLLTVRKPDRKKGEWGEPEEMTLAAFKKWASYGHGTPGYWLECYPPKDWEPIPEPPKCGTCGQQLPVSEDEGKSC